MEDIGRARRSRSKNGKFFHPFYTCGQPVVQNTDRFQSSCPWHGACTSESMERYITASLAVLLGVLILGTFGVFLVYVPILPLAVVVIILLGLILMFMLGVQTGGRIRISQRKNASRLRVAQWSLLNRAVERHYMITKPGQATSVDWPPT